MPGNEAQPEISHRPIATPLLVLVFAVTVPVFFAAGFLALWLIETEVWLSGRGAVGASDTQVLHVPETSRLAFVLSTRSSEPLAQVEPLSGGGRELASGTEIARFALPSLDEELAELTRQLREQEAALAVKRAQLAAMRSEPVDQSAFALDLISERNANERARIAERLQSAELAHEQGALATRDLEDVRWLERDAEIESALIERREQRAAEIAAAREQRLAVAQAEIAAAELRVVGLQEQCAAVQARQAALSLRTAFDAHLVWHGSWNVGDLVPAGTAIATAHASGDRVLQVTVDEDVFVHAPLGARVRFTSDVVSVYQYDYYWGEVVDRRVVAAADGAYQYRLTATLNAGEQALPLEQLPLGSGGQADIAVGRKSLLAQMVGW